MALSTVLLTGVALCVMVFISVIERGYAMRSSTGRWVSGNDFFNRERELAVLEARVRERNHLLLTGQRRMGKTSILQELGRQLESDDWLFLFVDVEGAICPEDAIASIAQAAQAVRPVAARAASDMKRWFSDNIDEITAFDFGVKFRAGLDAGSWRRHGENLLRGLAAQEKPVLLVIDELPIFLKRLLRRDGNADRVDEFLSWLRGALQGVGDRCPVLIVSGSIGLEPLVRRLGLPDRINHLHPFRLGPWNREASVACFERLAASHDLPIDVGVADAVYDALGIGIPHHVQSFFARLRDFAMMRGHQRLRVEDLEDVYRNELLGPSGQNDLVHYQTRLKEALDDEDHSIAMEILAEAAVEEVFTPTAHRCLIARYSTVVRDASDRIADTLDVLVHDGYLEAFADGYRFPSRLLRDWWAARFRDHHVPLATRGDGHE